MKPRLRSRTLSSGERSPQPPNAAFPFASKLKAVRKESARINRVIEEEFESIEAEDRK